MSDMSPRHTTSHNGWNEALMSKRPRSCPSSGVLVVFCTETSAKRERHASDWWWNARDRVSEKNERWIRLTRFLHAAFLCAQIFGEGETSGYEAEPEAYICFCYKTTSLVVSPSCPHAHSCYPDVLRVHPLYQRTTLILSLELLERKVSL